MKNSYLDLIKQSYDFPQEGFGLSSDFLTFNEMSIKYLIEKYGTPFKMVYLPRIAEQIKKARALFDNAIKKNDYSGSYQYCYCTKCCHFSHVIKAALQEKVHLETSSTFDIDLIFKLLEGGQLTKEITIVHNGYKTNDYLNKIMQLSRMGFENSIIVLDSKAELKRVKALASSSERILKVGIRMAIDEEPQSSYHTSRLGIRHSDILDLYQEGISADDNLRLEMVHFYIDSGIKDNVYYWGEFQKALKLYVQLKKISPTLSSLNLGGGFPIRNNLGFKYDYEHMANEIVSSIKSHCVDAGVAEPDIYTEFGKYTVGESGAIIFEVLEQKQQNDQEVWYLVNNSLMNTIPDAWSILEKFILLPINKWQNEYVKVNVGGISCDHSDYYNSEDFNQQLFLPKIDEQDAEPLYVGFFHTGAYQDAISGYGGIKHCLIPAPKLIVIDKDENGNVVDYIYRNEQTVEDMLEILGY